VAIRDAGIVTQCCLPEADSGYCLIVDQKWMIKSLAAMTAQFLDGGIPAFAFPLNASAFSER
jgi:hypothetical protein